MRAYLWGGGFNTAVWGMVLTFYMFNGFCKSCYIFLALKVQVGWNVTLCNCVSSSRRHETSWPSWSWMLDTANYGSAVLWYIWNCLHSDLNLRQRCFQNCKCHHLTSVLFPYARKKQPTISVPRTNVCLTCYKHGGFANLPLYDRLL